MKLENDCLRLALDGSGRIISFADKRSGVNIIAEPVRDPFMLTLVSDDCMENIVWGGAQSDCKARIDPDACRAEFLFDRLAIDNGRADAGYADISIKFIVSLDGSYVDFTAEIDNRGDYMISDFEYPRVGKIKSLSKDSLSKDNLSAASSTDSSAGGQPDVTAPAAGKPMSLFWPEQPGRLYHNIGARLAGAHPHRENGSNCMKITYPGTAMMGMCALLDGKCSLFLSLRDPDFIAAELKAEGLPEDGGAVTLVADKNLCFGRGRHTAPPVRIDFYEGDWHRGAAEYAEWMNNYRPQHTRPDWVREMSGYFLVINKQQFGYEMWDYTTLPELYRLASAHGFDTLGLFGWYDTGHDNNYPDLEVSDSMGGEETLKQNIQAVKDSGGHVTLYYQGHLIDLGSDYYKSGEGQRVACKTIWGANYAEYYSKSHKSDFLANYSRKMFAIACPSCPEWRELMCERERWIQSLGASGTLYDQIGGMPPYICFDKSHPHDGGNPARALPGGQTKMLAGLQKTSKRENPDFALMSEHITDLYSAYLDAVHGISNLPGRVGERGEPTGVWQFPDVFRYCFPEVPITLRNPNPFIERRAVNYAFVFGFIPELELRYRADREDIRADKYKPQREYAALISAFRKPFAHSLASMRYTDDIGIHKSSRTLIAKGYRNDADMLILVWNDSPSECKLDITIEGGSIKEILKPDGSSTLILPPDSVAIVSGRGSPRGQSQGLVCGRPL